MAERDPVVENLIVDLLEWLTNRDRTYEEVMEAWRTSCPKLPVWEEANERGLVRCAEVGEQRVIRPTKEGLVLVREHRTRHPVRSEIV